jgi:hypothetical protein
VPLTVPEIGVVSRLRVTSSEDDVPQAAELMVQRRTAIPGVLRVAVLVEEPRLVILAFPLTTDQVAFNVPGLFALRLKVPSQSLRSVPALAWIRLSSVTVSDEETAVHPLLPVTVTVYVPPVA